ncbi:MAG: phosphotransferase [Deltaproteobacteria bacterium]
MKHTIVSVANLNNAEVTATISAEVLAVTGLPAQDISEIKKGGSRRRIFRIKHSDNKTLICVIYDAVVAENVIFAPLSAFLQGVGISVPQIISFNKAENIILMQDLGDEDLFSFATASHEEQVAQYSATLREVRKLHTLELKTFPINEIALMPSFSHELYRWERNYFWEHFICRIVDKNAPAKIPADLEAELTMLADNLLAFPASLIHRDFQSQNVMVHQGKPFLIDFQGMRLGNPFYDVASLLYDPYRTLDEATRNELFLYYCDISQLSQPVTKLKKQFLDASLQRLLQALGAYGFLSEVVGNHHFRQYIPQAICNLQTVILQTESYPKISHFILSLDKKRFSTKI